jgi:hypothetical protein
MHHLNYVLGAMTTFSKTYRFFDWPNAAVPTGTAGVYAVWRGSELVYCGMSGRQFSLEVAASGRKYGLYTRLASHAAGRLSGDQFCVYVANRLVLPGLTQDVLPRFGTGELTLDMLTKRFIREHLEYQFALVASAAEAFALEAMCRQGRVFGVKPLLNPSNRGDTSDA